MTIYPRPRSPRGAYSGLRTDSRSICQPQLSSRSRKLCRAGWSSSAPGHQRRIDFSTRPPTASDRAAAPPCVAAGGFDVDIVLSIGVADRLSRFRSAPLRRTVDHHRRLMLNTARIAGLLPRAIARRAQAPGRAAADRKLARTIDPDAIATTPAVASIARTSMMWITARLRRFVPDPRINRAGARRTTRPPCAPQPTRPSPLFHAVPLKISGNVRPQPKQSLVLGSIIQTAIHVSFFNIDSEMFVPNARAP